MPLPIAFDDLYLPGRGMGGRGKMGIYDVLKRYVPRQPGPPVQPMPIPFEGGMTPRPINQLPGDAGGVGAFMRRMQALRQGDQLRRSLTPRQY